jgi:YggT family protein
MQSILVLFSELLGLYVYVLVAAVVLSWAISFNVINTRNSFVYQLGGFLNSATEPVLRPIRNLLPPLGGLDVSPLIAIFAIYFIRDLLCRSFEACGFRF